MTSSDKTSLRPGEIEAFSARVGATFVGRPGDVPLRANSSADTEEIEEEMRRAGCTARIAVVGAKFNGAITARLLDGVLRGLDSQGVDLRTVTVAWVPGAFEIPLTAKRLASTGSVDAVVAVGAVIRGDTAHFEFVAGQCAAGCKDVALSTGVPVIFAVLTTENVEQALERSAPDDSNRGLEAAVTALEMIDLARKMAVGQVEADSPVAGSRS